MAKPQDITQAVSQVMYERLADIPEVAHLDAHVRSDYADSLARAALAAVREHLPVKPDRETVARAIDPGAWRDEPMPERPGSVTDEEWGRIWDRVRTESKAPSLVQADAVLDLLPGRSEAEVKAEALREFARSINLEEVGNEWEGNDPALANDLHWAASNAASTVQMGLYARADRLAAEGGDDRG